MPATTYKAVSKLALSLPRKSRGKLAAELLESLEDDSKPLTEEEWNAAWLPEIERLDHELKSGKVKPISAKEALDSALADLVKFRKQRRNA